MREKVRNRFTSGSRKMTDWSDWTVKVQLHGAIANRDNLITTYVCTSSKSIFSKDISLTRDLQQRIAITTRCSR